MPLPYPDHELLSQPVQYPTNNPPFVPQVQLSHEAQALLIPACSAVANEVSYVAGQSGPRVFCYNMLSDSGWANQAFSDVVRMVCDTAIMHFRQGGYNSPFLALNASVKETLTLFTSMLVISFPDLMRNLAPEQVRAAEDNFRIYEERMALLNNVVNQARPGPVAGYGGRGVPVQPPTPARSYGRAPVMRTEPLAHPGGGAPVANQRPQVAAQNMSRVERDKAKAAGVVEKTEEPKEKDHITGEIESMDRNAHSIVYFGQSYKIPTPPLRRRLEEAVERVEQAAETKTLSETHFDETAVAASSLDDLCAMVMDRYCEKSMDSLDVYSTIGLVANTVIQGVYRDSLADLRAELCKCATFADVANVLKNHVESVALNPVKMRVALSTVSQVDRIMTKVVNSFLGFNLRLPSVRITSFIEDAATLGKYLSDKYKAMYNKSYTNFQRDVMEELMWEFDESSDSTIALVVAYNVLYVTGTSTELGYKVEEGPKRISAEATPLLHRLIKAARAQTALAKMRTSQILMVASDGVRYGIYQSHEDGDVYNIVKL